jgi:hypothetical protein
LKILVDFDNLDSKLRLQSLIDISDSILTRFSQPMLAKLGVAEFRLYGGWAKGSSLTTVAQRLSSEIQRSFPKIISMPAPIRITMELAQSLEAFPLRPLGNTLRKEPIRKILFQQPTKTTCRNASCPIEPLYGFFWDEHCPVPGCSATPYNLGSQEAQKMVDTMLVADLLYLSHGGHSPICVVSADDDMWPGILSSVAMGTHVLHLQPRYNGQSSGAYMPRGTKNYEGIAL